MANNVDLKDFTLGTARTMKTRETSSVNTPLHQIEDSTGAEVMGTTADAVVAAGAAGSIGAKLRRLTADIGTLIASIANTTSTGWLAVNLRKSDGTEIGFNANGQATKANSASVVLASDQDPVKLADQYAAYETVAASQTDQAMGATGAVGDYLAGVLVVPGTAAAGPVSIKDGSGSAINIFAGGGTTPLPSLVPFFVPLGLISVSAGGWKITTGANVTAIGIGKFT
jgi:hypothetical protein